MFSFFKQNTSPGINYNNKYVTKDFWVLKKHIDSKTILSTHVFFSLEAVSFFTNILTDLLLQTINNHLHETSNRCSMPQSELTYAIDTILNCTSLFYQNHCYKQTFGIPMSSSLSPVIITLVLTSPLSNSFKKSLSTVRKWHCSCGWRTPHFPQTPCFFIHPRLQFTLVKDSNWTLNFLDLTLLRQNNGKILTNWYTKTIASDRYTSKLQLSTK